MTVSDDSREPAVDFSAAPAEVLIRRTMAAIEDDGSWWKARFEAFLTVVVEALTWKRDRLGMPLSASVVAEHFKFDAFLSLAGDAALPDRLRARVDNLLDCVPMYDPQKGILQNETTLSQFGWVAMNLRRALLQLAETGR